MPHSQLQHISDQIIFHLCRWQDWQEALDKGFYTGSQTARQDGFLHFSSLNAIQESAERHLTGYIDLYALVVETKKVSDLLKWETSPERKMLFPHVYGTIPLNAIITAIPVPLGAKGAYIFPDLSLF